VTHPNPSTALATTVVDELIRCGVHRFVVCPGSRSTALALAVASDPRADCWVAIDERSAGFMALGMGKVSGVAAAVIVTSGTAVANLHPAVVEADLSASPLLVLSANRPFELLDVGANQTIEQTTLFGSALRWQTVVPAPEDRVGSNPVWRSLTARAVAEANGIGREPGPVQVDLAFREPLVPASHDGRVGANPFVSSIEGRWGDGPWTRVETELPGYPVMGLPEDLDVMAGMVVVGEARYGPAAAMFAQYQGWPLVAEPLSGVRHGSGVDLGHGKHPSITTSHHLLGHPGFGEAYTPDVVIRFGRSGLSRTLEPFCAAAGQQVVVDPFGWTDPGRGAHRLLRAVPISRHLDPPAPSDWLNGWLEIDRSVRRVIDGVLDRLDVPTEPRTARDAARAVPDCGRMVVASSMPVRDLHYFMEPLRMTVIGNRGASGIDGFVSTALGVAAVPGPVPVALAGDLSMLHDSNGFLTGPAGDCVFVVVNNDGGGIFSFLPPASHPDHFERLFGTPHGRSFERLAGLHGLGHRLIESAVDLIPAIEESREAGGIHLLEVQTDRAVNVEVHEGISAGVTRALDTLVGPH
jgi:2-succinyl-5-enolpyruvyl-6-hydroxy-3-cyclohexene-1-carboxylate synthase